jgi:hypothetical protein
LDDQKNRNPNKVVNPKFKHAIGGNCRDHKIVKTTFQVIQPGVYMSPELVFYRKVDKRN